MGRRVPDLGYWRTKANPIFDGCVCGGPSEHSNTGEFLIRAAGVGKVEMLVTETKKKFSTNLIEVEGGEHILGTTKDKSLAGLVGRHVPHTSNI